MFKFIKQNWLITVISGGTGSAITLFAIFALHVKTWDSNAWGAFFNLFVALGTISLALFGWMAYKDYWKQKKESTIYERIIKSTSLIHTEILQLRSYINDYASNIVLHLNSATPEPITMNYLNDLIYDTNNCLSYIKNFHNNITNWQSELDYIHLFTISIKKEIITTDIKAQFKQFDKDIKFSLFNQVYKIKQLLENYANQPKQNNSNSILLPVNPIEILIPQIINTETKIKKFIETVIKAFA